MGLGKTRRFKRKNGTRKVGGAGDVWNTCASIPPLALGVAPNKYITINVTSPETRKFYRDVEGISGNLVAETYSVARCEIEVVGLAPPVIKTAYYGIDLTVPLPTAPDACPDEFARVKEDTTDVSYIFKIVSPDPRMPALIKYRCSYTGDIYKERITGRRFTWYLNMKELRIPIYLTDLGAGTPNQFEAARATAARDAKFFRGPGAQVGPGVPFANMALSQKNRMLAARERRRMAVALEHGQRVNYMPRPVVVPEPKATMPYVPRPVIVPPPLHPDM